MNSLGDLFDAFYDRFLLRDLFGKAVPGSIVLLTLGAEGRWRGIEKVLEAITDLDLPTQLLLLGVAWVLGLAIQELSHCLGKCYPPFSWIGSRLWPKRYDCNKKRYTLREEVKEKQREKIADNQQLEAPDPERSVVLKESTGNTSMALVISALTVLLYHFLGEGIPRMLVTVGALVVAAVLLRYASSEYRQRQFDYWEHLAGGEPSCTTGGE